MSFVLRRKLLHLFFPNRCPVCGEIIGAMEEFCGKCGSELNEFTENLTLPGADSFTAPFVKDKHSDPAIFLMKDGIAGNAPYAFGGAMTRILTERGISQICHIILPAPMSAGDIRKRGYNQSMLLAKEISRRTGIPAKDGILIKVADTLPQKTLTKAEREVNLKGAFRVTVPDMVAGKNVLLVDDVCTTGSTLSELAFTLKNCGAAQVHCVCCCKTVKGDNNGNEPL